MSGLVGVAFGAFTNSLAGFVAQAPMGHGVCDIVIFMCLSRVWLPLVGSLG